MIDALTVKQIVILMGSLQLIVTISALFLWFSACERRQRAHTSLVKALKERVDLFLSTIFNKPV